MSLTPGAYDPRFMKPATLCRCGHILECCADCRGWLVEHSSRIADGWRYFVATFVNGDRWAPYRMRVSVQQADAAEAYALSVYESQR